MIITYLIQNKVKAIAKVKTKGDIRAFIKKQARLGSGDVKGSEILMETRLSKKKVAYLCTDGSYELEDCVFQLFPNP